MEHVQKMDGVSGAFPYAASYDSGKFFVYMANSLFSKIELARQLERTVERLLNQETSEPVRVSVKHGGDPGYRVIETDRRHTDRRLLTQLQDALQVLRGPGDVRRPKSRVSDVHAHCRSPH